MTKVNHRFAYISPMLALLFLLSSILTAPVHAEVQAAPMRTQAGQAPALQVSNQADGVIIEWSFPDILAAASMLRTLPTQRYQGYELPMQLIAVEAPNIGEASITILHLESQPWAGELTPAAPLQPQVIEWGGEESRQVVEEVKLPTAPAFVLRQGRIHGVLTAVIAISPLYAQQGSLQIAQRLSVKIAGAQMMDTSLTGASLTSASTVASSPCTEAPQAPQNFGENLGPTNPIAAKNAVKIIVDKAGIQEFTGEALTQAGLDLNTLDASKLRLDYQGGPIALQAEGLISGKLASTSILRFYAPNVGDRWNTTSIYWLSVDVTNGLRMATRDVTPAGATTRTTAIETGVWRQNQFYEPRRAGADGDHWFYTPLFPPASLQAAATYSSNVTVAIEHRLPSVSGTSTFSLNLTTSSGGQYMLQVAIPGDPQNLSWTSTAAGVTTENWVQVVNTNAAPTALTLSVNSPTPDTGILFDSVDWQRPVTLDFGSKGARFHGMDGVWHYTWTNLPAGFTLYDVTQPATPSILAGASTTGFQDGPTARRYLLSGPGVVQTPRLLAHQPVNFASNGGTHVIYIAPQEFQAALAPLVAHRQNEGCKVEVVDVQRIYDAWSFGHTSFSAIRNFLRFAADSWNPSPLAVIFVGDATWDPYDYEIKGTAHIFVPAYVAEVDPWLGETACDNCFVQLNGADPLTGDDPNGRFFSIDMWTGRFPVKTKDELTALVDKIIRYETTPPAPWQSTNIYLADNYVKSLGSSGVPQIDLAGDFAEYSEAIIALAPPRIQNTRVYYDPFPRLSDPDGRESWRIANAKTAFEAVIAAMNAGAGLVTYSGHSHHWQWAKTDESGGLPDYLFSLYDPDGLTNTDRPFIILSMTCYTSQFHKPAFSGTVLDERSILKPRGGAVAVWGPTGLGVAYGHDLLQQGFHQALWGAPRMQGRLGELTEAGYTELLTKSPCCQEGLRTFVLLGDPLTPARVAPFDGSTIYFPAMRR